jgi:hypothetical protein
VLKMESWDSFVHYLLCSICFEHVNILLMLVCFSSVPLLFDCSEKKEVGKTGIIES